MQEQNYPLPKSKTVWAGSLLAAAIIALALAGCERTRAREVTRGASGRGAVARSVQVRVSVQKPRACCTRTTCVHCTW